MAEINKVGSQPIPQSEQQTTKAGDAAQKIPAQTPPETGEQTATTRGNAGQPVGLQPREAVTQNTLMPEAVIGRDATQLLAADKLRSNGGAASATDKLLGLNQQPSMLGGLLAPPGNLEALRHSTPSMRRNILRTLLSKQRSQMRRLVAVARDEERHQQQREEQHEYEESASAENPAFAQTNQTNALVFHNQRVYQELASTTKMLDLLDELLNMQDYTVSQMGTFAPG